MKVIIILVSLVSFVIALIVARLEGKAHWSPAPSQEAFRTVNGNSFNEKFEAARTQGKAQGARFWVAYSFDVRPGVHTDSEFNRESVWINGISVGASTETRNLGVFLLHELDGQAIVRIEVYNLERKREYSGHPVYWLGRSSNDDSANLLRRMIEGQQDNRSKERAATALALHDDSRVNAWLKNYLVTSKDLSVRQTAAFWVGQADSEIQYLTELISNDQEPVEVRKNAVLGLGVNQSNASLSLLQRLYSQAINRDLKRQIIFAVSIKTASNESEDFLLRIAQDKTEKEMRHQAIFWLGHKGGAKSLKFLAETAGLTEGDLESQKQAVNSIGRRPKAEAVPLLIKIAREHTSLPIRKQAIMLLGRSGDERALAYLNDLIAK